MRSLIALAALVVALPLGAQGGRGRAGAGAAPATLPSEVNSRVRDILQQIRDKNELDAAFFPPEVVMQHQAEIELQDAQRSAITAAMQSAQAKFVDLQWKISAEN